MIPNKVLYTDGRGITVTDSTFQVNKTSYQINGITKHGLFILRPERVPGMLLLIVGFLVAIVGILNLIPSSLLADVQIKGDTVNANVIALWAGAAVAIIGLIILCVVRERYAVRISTAEGEKNAVVSNKKEYISQIVNALNDAFSHHNIQSVS
jgi:Family of unknown function (DUF6232)